MNKYFFIALVMASVFASAQSKTDTTLVDKNSQRIGDLKTKLQEMNKSIEEGAVRQVSNYELLEFLKGMDAKISKLADRQDSIITEMNKQQAEEAAMKAKQIQDNAYYIVIESHLSAERAQVALANHQKNFKDAMVYQDADAGRWYFVLLGESVDAEAVQQRLAFARKIVPTAWYVKGADLRVE